MQFMLYVLAIAPSVLKAHAQLKQTPNELLTFFVSLNCFLVPFLFLPMPFQSELIVGMALLLSTMSTKLYDKCLRPMFELASPLPPVTETAYHPSRCPSPVSVLQE